MKKIIIILLFIPNLAFANQIIYPVVYGPTSQVTNVTLNGNNTAISNVVNGGLDNTNANTTSGYRFYQTVSVLPTAGNQGAVYFLTSDDSLNFDTGAVFTKSVSIQSPSNGGIPYYNSGWNGLSIGASGLPIVSNGTLPIYGIVGAIGGGTGANLSTSTQGSVPYFSSLGVMSSLNPGVSGQVLQSQGASANPIWTSLPTVLAYGGSTSSSSAQSASNLKIAYGINVSVGGGSSVSITNLPFTNSSSYTCLADETSGGGSDENRGATGCTQSSGSAMSLYNTDNSTHVVNWYAIGV